MAENSSIEWTDHTFNGWRGCTKVSPGCVNCYAEALSKRTGHGEYRKGVPRERMGHDYWKSPLKWNKTRICTHCSHPHPLEAHGCINQDCPSNLSEHCYYDFHRPRVFSASLSDWLDDEVPIEWLADLLRLIQETPNLDWLLLTKRPENWRKRMVAAFDATEGKRGDPFLEWMWGWMLQADRPPFVPTNVWIGTTVENQEYADKRIPELLKIPARVRFLSCEPLLSKVLLDNSETSYLSCKGDPACERDEGCRSYSELGTHFHGIDWVICGGESGTGARPMHLDWARSLRDQCQAAGVPFFFKQHGEWGPWPETMTREQLRAPTQKHAIDERFGVWKVGKKAAGRLLDGREWNEFPV